MGGVLIDALFPRTYIDPNRAKTDLNADDLSGDMSEWFPFRLEPSEKSDRGIGLIWTRAPVFGGPMYPHRLSPATVLHRLSGYYIPYHKALSRLLDATHSRFGYFVHINCHSMASRAGRVHTDAYQSARPDFVIGDRDGTTCAASLTRLLEKTLTEEGYSVAINDPYKGVELVRAYSDPNRGRHSLQLEVNRRLYMDEATREPSSQFREIQMLLEGVMTRMLDWAPVEKRIPQKVCGPASNR